MQKPSRTICAFTLIELLVVIAVIAILAAMHLYAMDNNDVPTDPNPGTGRPPAQRSALGCCNSNQKKLNCHANKTLKSESSNTENF